MMLLAYFVCTFATLFGLAMMTLKISQTLAECPRTGRAARAAAVSVTTGFVAIGGGAILLIAAGTVFVGARDEVVLFAMGLACLILGLGFTQGVGILRDVVNRRPEAAVPMEPVLPAAPAA